MIDKTCNDNSSFAENPSPPVVCYDDEIQNDSYDRMSLIEPFAHHPEPEDLLSTNSSLAANSSVSSGPIEILNYPNHFLVTKSEYTKLLATTIELARSKETANKLLGVVKGKTVEIKRLQTRLRSYKKVCEPSKTENTIPE